MTTTSTTETAIKAVMNNMAKAYAERDLELMRSTLDETCFLYGTGRDEVARNADAVLKIVQRDWSQSERTQIKFGKINVHAAGDIAWTDCKPTFHVTAQGHTLTIPARLTSVFVRRGRSWRMVQAHFSLPSAEQAEGAAFPGQPMLVSV